MSEKACEICGSTRRVFINKKTGKFLCDIHRSQIYKNGRILERTLKDKNEIVLYENYAEIILYDIDNKEKARAIIDLEDVDLIKNYKWALHNAGYVVNTCGYKKCILLHRLITNCPKDKEVDHIDRNRLNCKRNNLRICEGYENSVNKGVSSLNTSGVTGVTWDKSRNKWQVTIHFNKVKIYIGRFTDFEDAVKARREAEIKYFGEFNPNNQLK